MKYFIFVIASIIYCFNVLSFECSDGSLGEGMCLSDIDIGCIAINQENRNPSSKNVVGLDEVEEDDVISRTEGE